MLYVTCFKPCFDLIGAVHCFQKLGLAWLGTDGNASWNISTIVASEVQLEILNTLNSAYYQKLVPRTLSLQFNSNHFSSAQLSSASIGSGDYTIP
jgi:hypothetical protein